MLSALAMMAAAACGPDRDREADTREVGQGASPAETVPDTPDSDSPVSQPGRPAPDMQGFRNGVAERTGSEVGMLAAVRVADHEGYERIVFEFSGALPGYKVEYIDRPVRQCGSGEVVALPGDAWLSMRFYPANAHTEEGRPSISAEQRRQDTSGRLSNLKRLELICDFEAVTEFVAAVGMPGRFRVLELVKPARIVVDIAD